MNGFRKLQQCLQDLGWYVGWNEPCCQSCAWGCLPSYLGAKYTDDGYLAHPETGKELAYGEYNEHYTPINLDKVLFNHSQDCEVYLEGEECPDCSGDGMIENPDYDTDQLAEEHDDDLDEFIDCPKCFGRGEVEEGFDPSDYDTSVDGFFCCSPEQINSSLFCFSSDEEGIKNLIEILPIIEECGCEWRWDKTGKTRIEINWSNE